MLPYRHIEVLTALYENPKGLTTGQIFNECKKKLGSELPDSHTVSKIIFSLRGKSKFITSSDAAGGLIHKITQKGIDALMKNSDVQTEKTDKTLESETTTIDVETVEPEAVIESEVSVLDDDPLAALESGVAYFIESYRALQTERDQLLQKQIDHKDEKIAVLKHFQQFAKPMNEDFYIVLGEIVTDLESA